MMRTLICTLLTLLASASFAAIPTPGYELMMKVSVDGGTSVMRPRLKAKAGERVTISQKDDLGEIFLEVVATEETPGQILMEMTVSKAGPDGVRKIISTPRISTMENEKATIAIGDEQGAEAVSISVVVKKTTL
jgi:hypothetical protein